MTHRVVLVFVVACVASFAHDAPEAWSQALLAPAALTMAEKDAREGDTASLGTTLDTPEPSPSGAATRKIDKRPDPSSAVMFLTVAVGLALLLVAAPLVARVYELRER